MTTSEQENDFGDALWNDNFYSSPSVISGSSSSNHIYNLKKTVLPNSASSQSISAYLQESSKQNDRSANDLAKSASISSTKSGPLQASPSLIALEKILNKEDGRSSPLPQTIIEEEEESAPSKNDDATSKTDVLARPHDMQKTASSSSVATFQTASSDRIGQFEYPHSESSASATTLSPVQDYEDKASSSAAEDFEDKTPKLGGPIQDDDDTTSKLGGPVQEAEQDISSTNPTYEPISVSPNLSLKSVETQNNSQHPVPSQPQRTPQASEFGKPTNTISKPQKNTRITTPKPVESTGSTDQVMSKQENEERKVPIEKPRPKYSSMLDSIDNSDFPKATTTNEKASIAKTKASKILPKKESPKDIPKKPSKNIPRKMSKDLPRKLSKDIPRNELSSQKSSPKETKEFNKPKHAPEKPINTKRFSFRTMFKSKSKNHSLSQLNLVPESQEPSKSVKLSHKSRSTPDFSSFKKSTNPPSTSTLTKPQARKPEARKSLFTRRKSEGSTSLASQLKSPGSPKKNAKQDTSKSGSKNEKPLPEVSTPRISPPKTFSSRFTPSIMSKKSPTLEQSSMASPSVFSVETPSTALLHQGETIREVEDSDFLPEHYQDTTRVNAEFSDVVSSPDASPDLSMQGQQSSYFGQSLDPKNPIDMGSPFVVSYDGDSLNEENGRMFSESPNIGPSLKSTSNRSLNAQLAGEALFPKLLDPHEVESIVSLERSRSMRSIKSNTKRSSFINYNGSDENIILGAEVGVLRQPSTKNSGGILKNSLSSRELKSDLLGLDGNDSFRNSPKRSDNFDLPYLDNYENSPISMNDERLTDFIEFTDFIDIENLDFAASPSIGNGSVASHRDSMEVEASEILVADSPVPNEPTPNLPPQEAEPETSVGEHNESLKKSPVMGTPDIVMVSSASSPELEASATPQLGLPSPSQQIASPLEKTYDFAVETSQSERNPSKEPRPVSMSFKGFKGSAFKDKILVQSGSHQSLHFDHDSFENSPVGQGFGSSDEDSDSDGEIDSHTGTISEESQVSTPQSNKRYSINNATSSSSRRQQHMRNVLDLQPPRASVPFHHNRIPSISDHSATSSPKSLSSFMSRIRKSPMASPTITTQKPKVNFSSRIILYDTYHQDEYDRHPEIGTCNQLTPLLAQQIKDELNELKANMEVHSDSICYTQFF